LGGDRRYAEGACDNGVRALAFALSAFLVASATPVFPQATTLSFDDMAAGRPPRGLTFGPAPADRPTSWVVVRDGTISVVAHPPVDPRRPELAIVEGTALARPMLSVRLRFPQGAGSAGLAWGYHDAGNYYAVALNLQSQEVRLYRVVAGNRTRLEEEDDLELDAGSWNTVKVAHDGSRMRVWINGVPVVSARDRAPAREAAVGLWTAGDAAVWFDNLQIDAIPEPSRTDQRD
jgi:hypothetical protein